MTPLAQQVLDVVSLHLGVRVGAAAVRASAAEVGLEFDTLHVTGLAKLLVAIERHLGSLVTDGKKRDDCMRELRFVGTHMTPTPSLNALMTVPLVRDDDAMKARSVARSLAKSLGFTEDRVGAITATVVDLATEVLKHAKRGALVFRKLGSPAGLEVTAFDGQSGPASEKRSLAAVSVKADRAVVENQPHIGTTVRVEWYLTPRP